jgi:hypothetical protein
VERNLVELKHNMEEICMHGTSAQKYSSDTKKQDQKITRKCASINVCFYVMGVFTKNTRYQ